MCFHASNQLEPSLFIKKSVLLQITITQWKHIWTEWYKAGGLQEADRYFVPTLSSFDTLPLVSIKSYQI